MPARRMRGHIAALMMIVMLFASVAPTVSHALARAGGSPYTLVEACTTQGLRVFAVASDGSVVDEVPRQTAAAFEHCQFCALSLTGAPPPLAASVDYHVEGLAFAPTLFLQAPRTLPVWRTAPARAPPR